MSDTLRDRIAGVIDPAAMGLPGVHPVRESIADRRAAALAKADEIIGIRYEIGDFPDLPDALRAEIGKVAAEFGINMDELLGSAPPGERLNLPGPILANDGRPLYTALIKVLPDASLLVSIMVEEGPDDPEADGGVWCIETLRSPEAMRLGAELEVTAAGGGRA